LKRGKKWEELGRTGDARATRTGRHGRALRAEWFCSSGLREFEIERDLDRANQ